MRFNTIQIRPKYLLERYSYYKNIISLNRQIEKKNQLLKNKGVYMPFPFNDIKLLICNYPYYKSRDRKFFDFFYSANGIPDKGYIPLTTYYTFIEPKLNNIPLLHCIADKNSYNILFPEVKTPRTLLRKINGFFYDERYNQVDLNVNTLEQVISKEKRIIIKPSIDSGSGKNIVLFTNQNGVLMSDNVVLDINYLKKFPDLVLQEHVEQHSFFQQFNPYSNNTIRIFTYRSVLNNKVHILHFLLRIGKEGFFLDHDNFGGVAAGIDFDYKLNPYCFDINGIRLFNFNNYDFSDRKLVPFMTEIEKIAINLANKIYYARLLAFDFTVSRTSIPMLLDINCFSNGISQYQMNNGGLFKDFTQEILDYCQAQME